jgi:hypothetical protein
MSSLSFAKGEKERKKENIGSICESLGYRNIYLAMFTHPMPHYYKYANVKQRGRENGKAGTKVLAI